MPVATKSEVGDRFIRLVVLREVETHRTPNGTSVRRVECKCDCGVIKVCDLPRLRNGRTKSCGCLGREGRVERWTTHGCTGTPEYGVWCGMRSRCENFSNGNYGGRGIRVCERWGESFSAFLEDMGSRPSAEHSIDRIDNDGNYEPGNCRWATSKEQGRNTRKNVLITHGGETLCVAEWAERYGISATTLNYRMRTGWDFENAVSVASRLECDDMAFLRTPISKRDAAWYREYERRRRC